MSQRCRLLRFNKTKSAGSSANAACRGTTKRSSPRDILFKRKQARHCIGTHHFFPTPSYPRLSPPLLLIRQVKDWTAQPISMRHPFLFYYGHVNSFTKIKALPHVTPSSDDVTFSRGIDPVVLDPSKCHSHPEVPPTWPSREEVIRYVAHTRAAVMEAVEAHKCSPRMLQMGLEHERMHQETLMYMLTQARRLEWERDPPAALPRAVALPRDWAKKWARPDVQVLAGRVVSVHLSHLFYRRGVAIKKQLQQF